MQSLHLISLLLQYPSLELQAVAGEIRQWLTGDPALPQAAVGACEPLLTRLATTDIYDCQEAYVDLFDRGRAHSLHLFEHVHGERDRKSVVSGTSVSVSVDPGGRRNIKQKNKTTI